jgi:hypothetical protein
MNPTDKVDDLLAKAGADWRAGQPSAPEPDLDRITGAQRKRRWLIPTLAAASVAAIATAALIVLPDHNEPAVAPPPNSPTPQIAQGTKQAGNPSVDDLLVRNGDKVEVNGQVITVPGKDPVFCPPLPSIQPGYPPGKEPAPACDPKYSVKLIGFDLGKLTDPTTTKGVRSGGAHVTGIWQNQTITVEEQSADVPPVDTSSNYSRPRCPEPAGGWPSLPSNIMSRQVNNFLDAKADQINGPIVRYPYGTARKKPVVIEIGVAHGDLAAFRKTFQTIYQGNLCVVPTNFSRNDEIRLSDQLADLGDKVPGMYGGGGQSLDTVGIGVSVLVVTEQVRAALTPLGLQNLNVNAAVRPVR